MAMLGIRRMWIAWWRFEHEAAVIQELARVGFEEYVSQPPFRRFRHRLEQLLMVDVMCVNSSTFAKMESAAQMFNVMGQDLPVPSLGHLIALKLHAAKNELRTQKDLSDINELLRVNPGKLSAADLKKLCDQFGTPTIEQQLISWL